MHGKETFNMCNFTLNIIFRVSIEVSTSGFFFFLQKKSLICSELISYSHVAEDELELLLLLPSSPK